jgi:hypothetical protein
MTKFPNVFRALIVAAGLAGLILPQVASAAGGKSSGGRARPSSRSSVAPSATQSNSPSVQLPTGTTKSRSSTSSSGFSKAGKLKGIVTAPGRSNAAGPASGPSGNAPGSRNPYFRGRMIPGADLTPRRPLGGAIGGGAGAGSQQAPLIPRPNPLKLEPKLDLDRVRFPGQIELPGRAPRGPQGGGARSPRIPRPDPSKIGPKLDLERVPFPGQIELPGNAPRRPQGGGAQSPRIPRPDPLKLEPNFDLERVRFPNDIALPGPGNGDNPPGDNPPGDNPPGDNPPGDVPPGDVPPGDVPPDDVPPGDNPPPENPPIVPIPFPIFWPLYAGGGYCPEPYYPGTVVGDAIPQTAVVVDLLLEDVRYVEAATLLVGPAYRVKFRNQGAEPVGKFRVALLAGLDGRVSEDSPQAMVEVAGLVGGESRELTIRLPGTAMRLASAAGRATAFTDLFVAVDIDNVVAEVDKTNNVAILERTLLEEEAQ